MVDQYSCPAVASDLHDFPHWTFRFHSFPSNSTSGAGLDFTNKDYLETLAMWTGIPLVVAGVVLVTSLVVMCCVCGNQSSEYDRIRKPRSRKCLSFLSILILLSAGAVIGLNVFLNKNVSSTQDDIKSVKSNYDGAIAAGNDLANYLRLSANFVNDISTRTQGQCQTDTRDMSNRLDNVAAQVSSVVAAAPVLSLDDVEYDTLSEVNRDRSIFTYAFEAVLVVLSLFLVSGCCGTRSKVMAGMLVGLVFLMVLLVYLFFGVQLSAMAGAGDFCYDPIAFGVAQLDNVQNADYYLVCSADSTFPYEDDFNQAEAALLAAQQALAELDAACNTTVSQADLDRINGMPLQSSAMLAALKVQVSCPPTHNLIVHGLNTMCSDGLKRVVVMEGCVSLQLLALSICLFLSIFLYQTTASQRRGLYEFDDESAPLLTPSFDSKPAYRSSSSSTNNGATTQVSSCRRCNKRLIAVVLLPCRHTLCRDCSLQCFTCPWCQATIQERQAIMYSPN